MLNVLLVCGSGASSGFVAANMRKEAAKRGLDMKITARSESEIENYIDEIDALMIGPHLQYLEDEMEERCEGTDVKVILMKPEYYSVLNGEKAIDHLLSVVGEQRRGGNYNEQIYEVAEREFCAEDAENK